MNIHTKTERQRVIETVIREGAGDQHRLLSALRDQGIETTQATISRDLREMGFAKVMVEPGVYRYEKVEHSDQRRSAERLGVLFREFVTDVRGTGNLVVVKTLPGNANGVARALDEIPDSRVLGTVAGDDTILVVVDSEADRSPVEAEYSRMAGGVSE